MKILGRRELAFLVASALSLLPALIAEAAPKARTVLVLPYATADLGREEQWIGEGVAQSLTVGFLQMPAVIQIDRERLKRLPRPEIWDAQAALAAARAAEEAAVRHHAPIPARCQLGRGARSVREVEVHGARVLVETER